jgi:hypothetical protein
METVKMTNVLMMIAGLVLLIVNVRAMAKPGYQRPKGKKGIGWTLLRTLSLLLFVVMVVCICLLIMMAKQWSTGTYVLLAIFCAIGTANLFLWVWTQEQVGVTAAVSTAAASPAAGHAPAWAMPDHAAGIDQQPRWPHAGLAEGLAAIRLKRIAEAQSLSRMFLWFAIPGTVFVACTQGPIAAGIAILGSIVMIGHWHQSINGINQIEYRTLPGSKDASGKQRCVYCSRYGVYKHGQYRTNSTWHQCTGCKKHLFVD